jgi:hypothetical protein
MDLIFQLFGFGGMILVLAGFILNESKEVSSDSSVYDSLNFFGAGLLAANACFFKSWPFLILNLVWCLVALRDLLKDLKK